LALDSRSGWFEGGDHGPAIVPGDPDRSLLVSAVRRTRRDAAMPPKTPLEPEEVAILERWVREGARDPRVLAPGPGDDARRSWWAIRPLVRRPVPAADVSHPVDAWLAAAGHPPGPAQTGRAGRVMLLRRLMVDLHGILPTPEETEAFVNSPLSDAEVLAREVDRLLDSPRYGERWARHWLDVVHFAETHGHDQDRPRDNAWPYRDYVVAAFNADKPYARFVQEQIAADALFPDSPELIPALGFLAAGPWDESSLRDIREDVLDREIGRYLDRDDIVANVFSTFASTTAQCARCHDHKFDPITQRDYYALQAVFAGTEKAERLYDHDPAVHATRQKWMRIQVALERKDRESLEALLDDGLRADQRAWEASERYPSVDWTPWKPERWVAELPSAFDGRSAAEPSMAAGDSGTNTTRGLKVLDDASLLAFGPAPATNIYLVSGRVPASGATGLRLELLPDASLPARGPGRAENGNLHLTGFEVYVRPPGAEGFVPVALANPSASFEQEGWGLSKAFDADPITGWGIHPKEGESHVATFEFVRPEVFAAGHAWRVVLRQEHGRGHSVGRFRLSLTTNAPPLRATATPEDVLRALAVAPERRTPEERFTVAARYLSGRAALELARLPEPKRVYAGASIFPANGGQKPLGRPREVRVLRRGEVLKPMEPAEPGALACIPGIPARFGPLPDESARRAALARWLTDPSNAIVWRSVVNRVWHYHFGRGLVETPNDFGRMGGEPSHPELLDWLATTFRDDFDGSPKKLHRLILGSAAWRQRAVDPQSPDRFRPLRRRLDAESFRDSVLRFAGVLDDTMGGPSVRQFAMSPGIHVTPKVDYAAYDPEGPGSARRSIYRFLFRTLPDPMMDVLDSPPGNQSQPVRSESFTALQAFALLNHPFVVRHSEQIARRVAARESTVPGRVARMVELVLSRSPAPDEVVEFAGYAERHGLPGLCRLLLNSNELHFVD
ncbi:MAG: PSD1 domain-containing protein, partial [Verrucomicrobiales bacterium]|nr:PSD1 domain-containing protein [Verrucomicrobiales bacterium]